MTIINFTVTMGGLEQQLLSRVVQMERPELEEQKKQAENDKLAKAQFDQRIKKVEVTMFEQLIKLAKVQGMLANITQLPHASDVDELQGMVNASFVQTEQMINAVAERVEELNRKFDLKFDQMSTDIEALKKSLAAVKKSLVARLEKIEETLGWLVEEVVTLRKNVDENAKDILMLKEERAGGNTLVSPERRASEVELPQVMGTPAWLSDAQAALDETKAPPQTVPLQMVASRLTKAQEEQIGRAHV